MNIIKKFMDSGTKTELMTIPAGQFFLLRSSKSPKASIECLYNDATLAIRESSAHVYKLVVRKEMDESESTGGDENEDFDDEEISILSGQSKKDEEWSFTLDESLHFHKNWNKQGDMTFVWRNTKGDRGEKFQFVVNNDIPLTDIDQFLQAVYRCEYEYKYKRSSNGATEDELKQFDFTHLVEGAVIFSDEDDETEDANLLADKLKALTVKTQDNDDSYEEESEDDDSQLFEDAQEQIQKENKRRIRKPNQVSDVPDGKHLCMLIAELYVYDPIEEHFTLQDEAVKVVIVDLGRFDYWLSIQGQLLTLGTDVSPDVNPVFDMHNMAFIFNYIFENITLSYMLKFSNVEACTTFQSAWSRAIWEFLNKRNWADISEAEQKYVLNASSKREKELSEILDSDVDDWEDESSDEDGEEAEEEKKTENKKIVSASHHDSSDDEDAAEMAYQNSTALAGNKSLTIGFKNDRSYVVRGNKVGVFKSNEDDELEFVTAIGNITNLKGKLFNPENPMLYTEDRALIVQDNNNKSKLYKMDLERGQVVEEWSTGDKEVVQYGPSRKFDQLTGEQTFLGVSNKSIFKVDPRIGSEDKTVRDESKQYATKYNFSSLGTTENGYVAVGSEKGEIRLYDKLGIRAKTLIPALGEPIKHLCVSSEGKWLLATCQNSLLLIDLIIKEGRHAGSVGFLKSFSRDETPKIYVLRINPETVSYMQTTTGQPICFTKAYFNTGLNQREQTIVTSTGPFAITWSLRQIVRGEKTPYLVKRYDSQVMEDNFKFGSDRNVIVALKNDVSMVKKKSFRKPTKEVLTDKSLLNFYYDHDDAEVVKKWE